MVNATPRPHFTPGKDPVPTVWEAGWAPGPVWTGAENLALNGIRSPDRPACSESLYRLSYRGSNPAVQNVNLVPPVSHRLINLTVSPLQTPASLPDATNGYTTLLS